MRGSNVEHEWMYSSATTSDEEANQLLLKMKLRKKPINCFSIWKEMSFSAKIYWIRAVKGIQSRQSKTVDDSKMIWKSSVLSCQMETKLFVDWQKKTGDKRREEKERETAHQKQLQVKNNLSKRDGGQTSLGRNGIFWNGRNFWSRLKPQSIEIPTFGQWTNSTIWKLNWKEMLVQ